MINKNAKIYITGYTGILGSMTFDFFKEKGYTGEILWDDIKPNRMLKKCVNVSNMIEEGFERAKSLEIGLK
ncbi:hypothetical protein BC749_106135 [Flavobacterium araucananum]|uniref:NAD-dependent epimerase/dehydratase domain-containing protein n=1 Tax=Flavobacterium araucananum TaxID=946678 RepID=A0A227PFT0_9FLAO|nr:hypothetical protein [Flavobacterium araucananum]OXG08780.1 hypothetical protein B0A64_04975 [Flavobacterium araucananum]PWJ97728.1 hypothetical protein BC749_106135 [Flavobacterium araucananum]